MTRRTKQPETIPIATILVSLLLVVAASIAADSEAEDARPDPPADTLDQWPQWRGPLATGEAPRADPPVQWSDTENVRWKVEVPGKGHSTPVVWGDGLFLTTAVPVGEPLEPSYADADGAHDTTRRSLIDTTSWC